MAPADGSTTTNARPSFDWTDIADASSIGYTMQVDNNGTPSPEVNASGLAVSSFTPTNSLVPGTYSWRVRATDGAGNTGAWSAVSTSTFTIAPSPGSIEGTVTWQTTRQGLSGATVDCGTAGSAATTTDGRYSLTNVSPGSYTCTATAPGYKALSKSITVASSTVTELTSR